MTASQGGASGKHIEHRGSHRNELYSGSYNVEWPCYAFNKRRFFIHRRCTERGWEGRNTMDAFCLLKEAILWAQTHKQ